ncbi:MAG: hypothetical protein ACJZZ7_01835 [Cytophagales bacterium]
MQLSLSSDGTTVAIGATGNDDGNGCYFWSCQSVRVGWVSMGSERE